MTSCLPLVRKPGKEAATSSEVEVSLKELLIPAPEIGALVADSAASVFPVMVPISLVVASPILSIPTEKPKPCSSPTLVLIPPPEKCAYKSIFLPFSQLPNRECKNKGKRKRKFTVAGGRRLAEHKRFPVRI